MSGGRFNYDQYKIGYIADDIEKVIERNGKKKTEEELKDEGYRPKWWYDEYPEDLYHRNYPDEIIEEFKKAVHILRTAQIYAHRVDWFLSGNDGEENFLKRLKKDLDDGRNQKNII